MQKTAQKRSLLNKLRESTNISGIATEKFLNPEFQDLMNRLRNDTDDPVRAIVTGEQIGEASPPEDATSMKDLLKSAKSNLNRREYMKAVADLGRFHKKMNDVVRILANFKGEASKIHERFLFQDMDEESKKHLHDLKSRFAYQRNDLVKEANILDFFANIGTERGRALAGWEKRYPREIGKLKSAANALLSKSERMLGITIAVLKDLAKARSVRNPDKYIQDASKITKAYDEYDKIFRTFYNDQVKGFLEKQELITPTKTDESKKPQELGSQDVGVRKIPQEPEHEDDTRGHTVPAAPIPEALQQHPVAPPYVPGSTITEQLGPKTVVPTGSEPPSVAPTSLSRGPTSPAPPPQHESSSPPIPGPPPLPKMTPEERRQLELQHGIAHQRFYESLKKLSYSPPLMVLYIRKYAKAIQATDLNTAVKLFKLAKSIEV